MCGCVGGVRPGSGSLIDRPEHRGAVGDEERSDSGAARYSLIHCVSDTDNAETRREKGRERECACEGSEERNKGIHEYLGSGKKRCFRRHVSGDCGVWD